MLPAGAPLLLWAALAANAGTAGVPPIPPPIPEIAEEITVTAARTETPAGETAAGVTVLTAAELAESAAVTLDDTLRQVPGFTLFRRAGSLAANPTTQGASLRGLGGTAASRAAVLADGVPLNDPFGGWVAWGRVPRAALERVEVLRGGASDLWGSPALAGAVQLLRRDPAAPAVLAEASGGSLGTAEASLFAAGRRGAWAGSVAAEGFETDGYFLIDRPERGAVDARASSRRGAAEATVARAGEGGRWFLRGSFFDEDRNNGTRLQENATTIRRAEAGFDGYIGGTGGTAWAARAWAGSQDYRQTFSAVADDRESERLVRVQDVPAEELGFSLQGERAFDAGRGPAHRLVAGADLRAVEGTSFETAGTSLGVPGAPPSRAGGRQRIGGAFAEDLVAVSPRLSLVAALRWDTWANQEEGAGGEERRASAWSPRLSLVYRVREGLALSAAAYRSFRAPTLNELYRGFRVGDVVTLPNAALGPERLTGGEAGAEVSPAGGRLRLRGTLFWMELEDAVANVTHGEDGGTILRRRENLGRTRSRGAEAEGEARLGRRLTLSGSVLFADSEVRRFPADPSLEGLRVPQVPRWQGSLGLRFAGLEAGTASLQARWAGSQPDDDRNRFRLGGFVLVDAFASRPLGRGAELFLAIENLLDERVEVGRTPLETLGPPRLARLGLRWAWSPSGAAP